MNSINTFLLVNSDLTQSTSLSDKPTIIIKDITNGPDIYYLKIDKQNKQPITIGQVFQKMLNDQYYIDLLETKMENIYITKFLQENDIEYNIIWK